MNRGDMDAVRDTNDPQDYVYEQSGDVRVERRDAALEWFRQWRAAFLDLNGELPRLVVAGDTVVSEIRWTGIHSGAVPGAAGGAAATAVWGRVSLLGSSIHTGPWCGSWCETTSTGAPG
jgi:hypothetical protein